MKVENNGVNEKLFGSLEDLFEFSKNPDHLIKQTIQKLVEKHKIPEVAIDDKKFEAMVLDKWLKLDGIAQIVTEADAFLKAKKAGDLKKPTLPQAATFYFTKPLFMATYRSYMKDIVLQAAQEKYGRSLCGIMAELDKMGVKYEHNDVEYEWDADEYERE